MDHKRLTLMATILGSAIVFIDGTVVNVALPALRDDLGASLADQQWIVEAYLLLLGSLVLIGGSLGDLYGRRLIFTCGLIGFGAMSIMCALAPNVELLIGARALQGVAGALLVPSSLAILTDVFTGPARAKAIGTWTAWTSASVAVGPPLGGFLVDAVSWRLVFAINIPLVLLALWMTARAMPPVHPGRERKIDVVGAALCALGLGGPVYALIQQASLGWSSPEVVGGFAGGVVLLAAFVAWEAHHPDPMLPLGIFRSRDFSVGNVATLGIYAGLGSATFFLAIYLQQVGDYTALAAGFALLPLTLIMLALSSHAAAGAVRFGPRWFMGFGPLVAAVGFLLLMRVNTDPGYFTEVLPGIVVFGLGLSMTVAPLTVTVLGGADHEDAGIASGINNAVARVAGLLAIAIVGAVVAGIYANELGKRAPLPEKVLVVAEERPFVPPGDVDPSTARYNAAGARASEIAFDWGMGVSALMTAAGGIVALVGLRGPRRS